MKGIGLSSDSAPFVGAIDAIRASRSAVFFMKLGSVWSRRYTFNTLFVLVYSEGETPITERKVALKWLRLSKPTL